MNLEKHNVFGKNDNFMGNFNQNYPKQIKSYKFRAY